MCNHYLVAGLNFRGQKIWQCGECPQEFIPTPEEKPEEMPWPGECEACLQSLKNGHICGGIKKPEKSCDCHLHWHQVCDICQGVGEDDAEVPATQKDYYTREEEKEFRSKLFEWIEAFVPTACRDEFEMLRRLYL